MRQLVCAFTNGHRGRFVSEIIFLCHKSGQVETGLTEPFATAMMNELWHINLSVTACTCTCNTLFLSRREGCAKVENGHSYNVYFFKEHLLVVLRISVRIHSV